jgi:uncharacterized protein involved in outer membrane biogenesis
MKTPTIKDIRVAAAARKQRRVRVRRWAWGVAAVVVLGLLLITFVLPPLLRPQIEQRASAELGREVTLERLRLNPLRGAVTLEGLELHEPDGTTFMGWSRLHVDFDSWSLFYREWRFQSITLEGFHGQVRIDADGELNFADILARLPEGDDAEEAWPVTIGRLAVAEARVDFTDVSRATPFVTAVGPLTFSLRDFRTSGETGGSYAFTAETAAGESLAWRGTLSLDPLLSEGELRLGNMALAKYQPYLGELVPFVVRAGSVEVEGRYAFDGGGAEPALRLEQTRVEVRGLSLSEDATAAPQVRLDQLTLAGLEADLVARTVSLEELTLNGGRVDVHRTATGIDLLAWGGQPSGSIEGGREEVPAADAAWSVKVGSLAVSDFSAGFSDATTPSPAHHELAGIELRGRGLDTGAGAVPADLELNLTVGSGGTVRWVGTVQLASLVMDGAVELRELTLAALEPHLAEFVNASLPHGQALLTGRIAGTWPAMEFTGQANVRDFALTDLDENLPLLVFTTLDLQGITLGLEPLRLGVERVIWEEPMALLAVRADGSLNLSDLLVATERESTVELPGEPPVITIGQVAVREAAFTFTDESLNPAVRMRVHDLSGTVSGLDSRQPGSGEVVLDGRVGAMAPVTVRGRLNPLGQSAMVDLQVDLRQVDLLPTSPYVAKYAGYRLARGRLLADLVVRLDDAQLDSKAAVTLDQFSLGERTPGPEATSLPVALAVSLLKDSRGQIVLDLPVQGRLDDPEFSIGGVVRQVLVNLLTRVATSPFALLGTLLGGDAGEELSYQDFAPGMATLDPDDIQKLDTVARALVARPELQLEIAGAYDAARDEPVLRRAAMTAALRAAPAR